MSGIECVVYEYGSGIFNYIDSNRKKYRTTVKIQYSFTIDLENVHEKKNQHPQ